MKMKIWIIRDSAFSIQCGGLERLFIHFAKPEYLLSKLTEEDRDTPFGTITEQEGLYRRKGWESQQKMWVNAQSVGNWLGYENEVGDYIWKQLYKHFHNKPFDEWHELEKQGLSKIEDFCLEMEIDISLSFIKQ